jgi:translation initiation factor 2 alpha subunit (eIF-2alpha)
MAGNKLSDKEIKERVKKAYELRYKENYTQERYVKWAKEEYGDKSEQQYCQYFLKAREHYEESWRDLLDKQLQPATEELIRLLADENPKVRDAAIAKIFKYTGNEIQKIQADIKGDININFGD